MEINRHWGVKHGHKFCIHQKVCNHCGHFMPEKTKSIWVVLIDESALFTSLTDDTTSQHFKSWLIFHQFPRITVPKLFKFSHIVNPTWCIFLNSLTETILFQNLGDCLYLLFSETVIEILINTRNK